MIGIRDRMLACCERRYTNVPCPGVGVVRIQSMSEAERVLMGKHEDTATQFAFLITMAVVDESGDRIWAESDIPAIQRMDSLVTSTLANAIVAHCFGTTSSEDQLKNLPETSDVAVPST